VALRFGVDSSPSCRFRCPACGLLHVDPIRADAVATLIEAEVGCFHDALADDAVIAAAMRVACVPIRPPTDH
jgi:hypothetical protein